jgi:integrase
MGRRRGKPPITLLPSGRHQLRWRDYRTGRARAQTFDSYGEAERFYFEMLADEARGVWIDPRDSAVTFQEYAEQWRKGRPGAESTGVLIAGNLRRHLYPALGAVPLSRLRTTQLQAVITALLDKPLDASTIGVVLQHLRQVLNGAVQDRLIPFNPASAVKAPRVEPSEVVIPSPAEVAAIGAAIDPRHHGLVVVGAGLGLRQGEAFGLSRDRIDLRRRTVTIDRQLKRSEHGGSVLGALKTERSYRTVPLPESVATKLAEHMLRYPSGDPDGLLFQAPMGGRLRRDGWNRRVWKPAVQAAGRPELTFHALRHFYASALIRENLNPVVVARRLGNSPQMVQETYAHLWRDDDDRTRDAIDRVLA